MSYSLNTSLNTCTYDRLIEPFFSCYSQVRPFTLGQLKELLNRTGSMVEEGFWIDKIKSHCYVTVSTNKPLCPQRVVQQELLSIQLSHLTHLRDYLWRAELQYSGFSVTEHTRLPLQALVTGGLFHWISLLLRNDMKPSGKKTLLIYDRQWVAKVFIPLELFHILSNYNHKHKYILLEFNVNNRHKVETNCEKRKKIIHDF